MPHHPSGVTEKVKGVSWRLFIVLALFAIILLLFLFITDEIVLEKESYFDDRVFEFVQAYTSPGTTGAMIFFTFFGGMKFLFPAYCLLVLYFLLREKNKRRSFNIAVIGIGSVCLLFLLKGIFRRNRPPHPLLTDVEGFSFPSGHSFSAFTFCGLLIYVLWESQISILMKWAGSILLFVFAAMIALSRVYLQVHYASDVVAGFCLSVLWLTISIFVLRATEKKKR